MTTILAFVIVLGITVFVHESGHFAAAKLAGIRVLRFSLGFWKVLLSVKWRGTEYAVSLVPLGGYVKMAGGDERDREGAPDEFLSQPPWVRMLVALAGPAMNFALTVVLFALVAKVGYTLYTFPNRVGGVVDTVAVDGERVPSPARRAGFEEGDVIVAVDGRPTPYWFDIQRIVTANADRELAFDVRRGGRALTLRAKPTLMAETGLGLVGLMPYQTTDVSAVIEDSAAAAAGVTRGDRVTSLEGRPVATFNELLSRAGELPTGRYRVGFETASGPVAVAVDYRGGGADEFAEKLGAVCGARAEVKRSEDWLGAFPAGWARTREVVVGTARGMALVFKGRVKVTKALGGPITIARFAGETARAGFVPYVEYIAFLSVMLGMVNLLPIPVLDGGHILLGAIETARRKDLPARARELVTFVGYALLFGIVVLALIADFTRIFEG